METQQSAVQPPPAHPVHGQPFELQHLDVKVPLDRTGRDLPDLAALIPVFHRWVRERVADELLIDVADYRHVPAGPGVVLVGLEGTYSLDLTDGRPGLRYVRKAKVAGGPEAALAQALKALDRARRLLEEDSELAGRFRFDRRELELRVNDRLLAPNRLETFDAMKPELERFFGGLVGDGAVTVEYDAKPREAFKVTVRATRPIELSRAARPA